MLQSQMATSGPSQAPADSQEAMVEAPPKQVAMAMDRLAHAARLIADIRISADRFLEALFVAASLPHPLSDKPLRIILNQEESIRLHLHDLRSVGRQLEGAGVLNGSMRSRGNSWGLHMPLVCPDGAVVAYAWKRQLAGQAGASAVDRTRLALKAFTDQKKRFFPHIEDDPVHDGDLQAGKKQCRAQKLSTSHMAVFNEERNLSDVLIQLEKEAPQICIFTYQRLDWLKRSSSLSMLANENSSDTSKEQVFHASNNLRTGSLGAVAVEQIAVIELLVPSVFRAIISLHPAGSINPDAVAFFSPDEGGDYIHARGFSVYHIYRKITEHADKALQYFLAMKPDTSLDHLLHWICTYQTLFIKVCSACGRLLMMDKQLGLLLPPVCHPYRQLMSNNQNSDDVGVYHIRCLPGQA